MTQNRQANGPINSYRLQLGAGFDLAAAAGVLTYLRQLGITDCYTSPYLTAARGSASGYDVCDHASIQPELGGEEAFATFLERLRETGLGHIIDVVPNHMGTDEVRNRWWRDVLKHGRVSEFAPYFDIDWAPPKTELHGKLLLPILGKPYGAALDDGDVRVDTTVEGLVVRVGPHELPVDPATVPSGGAIGVRSVEDLHALLEQQSYRLAYWRTSSDEINYRRFFDVDDLVGLRMERPAVFDAAHARVRQLVEEGRLTGLRIDHADGLADPATYFERVGALADRAPGVPPAIVVEKILTTGESLPENWPAAGTTGYDFLTRMNGLFVDAAGYEAIRTNYVDWIGRPADVEAEVYAAKRLIMATTLASEIEMLAERLNRISERQRRSRDFTLNGLRRALVEFVARLPVYRTYLRPPMWRPGDADLVHATIERARDLNGHLEPSVFAFIESVLIEGSPGRAQPFPAADGDDVTDRHRFIERLQQFTGSVFAKAVEDTAFYRYQPLLSVNEVGGDPGRGTTAPADFHRECQASAAIGSRGLLPTATHDTKLGGDVRARLNVLADRPDDWARLLRKWRQLTRKLDGATADPLNPIGPLDSNDQYRFFQTLVGMWPFDSDGAPRTLESDEIDRLAAYMLKACREAKRHTSWINPNCGYETSLAAFVRGALAGRTADRLRASGLDVLTAVARAGVVNSLSQRLLTIGAPGVTDIYQGSELWDVNLVDPDNRRPVDFERRRAALDALEPLLADVKRAGDSAAAGVRTLLDDWPSGRIQLFVTTSGLRFRRDHPDVFLSGDYVPLISFAGATGETAPPPRRGDVVAFLRRAGRLGVLVIVPRLTAADPPPNGTSRAWPIGDESWRSLAVRVPDGLALTGLGSLLTGRALPDRPSGERSMLAVSGLLADLPVGLWRCDVDEAPPHT